MLVLECALALALIVVLLFAVLWQLGQITRVGDLILEHLEDRAERGDNDAPD